MAAVAESYPASGIGVGTQVLRAHPLWDEAGKLGQRLLEVEVIWAKGFVLSVTWGAGHSWADWQARLN